jgi:GMP reductase
MQKIIDGDKLDFCDVLIRPKRSKAGSRKDIRLNREFRFPHSPRGLGCIPIMAANMDTTGSLAMADALHPMGLITCLHKFHKQDDGLRPYRDKVWASFGIGKLDIEKQVWLAENKLEPNICIDVANGYTEYFVERCREVRERFPFSIIMAGNVCTPEMVEELIIHGLVDIVKVGIGPGSVCTTRIMTGVGYPQLSAIMECADAAHGLGGHICADGGCTSPGDIAKAFGGGADFVMLGGMLAGTDECDGEWLYKANKHRRVKAVVSKINMPWKKYSRMVILEDNLCDRTYTVEYDEPTLEKESLKFHGMSSREAMEEHYGGVAPYRAAEGKTVTVPYKGPVKNVVEEILGGLRSACSYVGAMNIKDMNKCTTFIRVQNGRTHNEFFGKS